MTSILKILEETTLHELCKQLEKLDIEREKIHNVLRLSRIYPTETKVELAPIPEEWEEVCTEINTVTSDLDRPHKMTLENTGLALRAAIFQNKLGGKNFTWDAQKAPLGKIELIFKCWCQHNNFKIYWLFSLPEVSWPCVNLNVYWHKPSDDKFESFKFYRIEHALDNLSYMFNEFEKDEIEKVYGRQ